MPASRLPWTPLAGVDGAGRDGRPSCSGRSFDGVASRHRRAFPGRESWEVDRAPAPGSDGARWLREGITEARAGGTLRTARLCDLVGRVIARGHPVRVVYSRGGWINVNNLADLVDASGI